MLRWGYPFICGPAVVCAIFGAIQTASLTAKILVGTIAALALAAPLIWRITLPSIQDQAFWPVFAIGLALRVAWSFSAGELSSDALTYSSLADGLLDKREYEIRGTRAFWPPGLPLALVATGSAVLLNGLIYIATAFLLFKLVGMWGVIALAVWPTAIMLSWLPSKELLCQPLLLGAVYAFRQARPVASGALVGLATLTYSAMVVFPAVFVLERNWRRLAIVTAVMLTVTAPWVTRNALVLGVPLLGSNGGINLFIGNNAEATGLFAEPKLDSTGELDRDVEARRKAIDWITSHPADALLLSMKKVIMYFGDDDTGAYWAIKRGHEYEGAWYEVARSVANLHWLALLFLAYVSAMRGAKPEGEAILALGIGVSIAAVFFGHTSHHIEFEGFLMMLAFSSAVVTARTPFSNLVPAGARWWSRLYRSRRPDVVVSRRQQ
jgi:hypothetical protein